MTSLFRSRKGQFYILIALLLISYAFVLAKQDVPIRKAKDNFQLIHEGYLAEGPVVINSAVYEGANVSAMLSAFTDDYVAFARSAEPGFRMVYLLKDGGRLAIGNRLDSQLNVTVSNVSYTVNSNSDLMVETGGASFAVDGVTYAFSFSSEASQLKGMFRTSDRRTKRGFVKGRKEWQGALWAGRGFRNGFRGFF